MVHLSPEDARVEEEVVRQYKGNAKCVFRPPSEGGRILVTTRKVLRGEIVGRSEQQMMVGKVSSAPEQRALWATLCEIFGKEEEDYSLHVLWSGLSSLTEADLPAHGFPLPAISEDVQRRICLHYVCDIKPSSKMIKLHETLGLRCTALKLERMVELWNCNSLDHTYRKQTSVLSLAFALMNHSCMPTVTWNFEGDEVVLRANCDLEEGSELSVSYIEDEKMHMPTSRRQQYILDTGKGFTCGCSRCSGLERSRHAACPAPGCAGVVTLANEWSTSMQCGTCHRALKKEEFVELLNREKELESILDDLQKDEEDPTKVAEDEAESDSDSSSDGESDTVQAPTATFDLGDIESGQLDKVREIATSGRWLAPTSHWLAHRSYGLLKDVAWSQKAGLATILHCLDQRAAFIRQAYPTTGDAHPPLPELGWELYEAAKLLAKREDWKLEWSSEDVRSFAAQARLKECIEVLQPMSGSTNSSVLKARKLLDSLKEGEKSRGKKRPRSELDAVGTAAGA